MNNGSSLIREIGRSYIVSSLIPASLFVILFNFLFGSFIQETLDHVLGGLEVTGTVFLILLVVWLAFLLYSSQDYIMKLFEGYNFFVLLKNILAYCQRKKYKEEIKYIEALRKRIKNPSSDYSEEDIAELKETVIAKLQDLELGYPLSEELILPTKFGNALRSSEYYAMERYGIDSLTIWPRLVNFLPKEFMSDHEEVNNRLIFLVNSTLLCFGLALFNLAFYIIQIVAPKYFYNPGQMHLWLGVILGLLGFKLYKLSISAAIEFGIFVRTAFDLYRHKLLEHLNEVTPADMTNERKSWEKLGSFMVHGQYLGPIDISQSSKAKKTVARWGWGQITLVSGILTAIFSQRFRRGTS